MKNVKSVLSPQRGTCLLHDQGAATIQINDTTYEICFRPLGTPPPMIWCHNYDVIMLYLDLNEGRDEVSCRVLLASPWKRRNLSLPPRTPRPRQMGVWEIFLALWATPRPYIGRVKNLNSGSPDTLHSAATQIP